MMVNPLSRTLGLHLLATVYTPVVSEKTLMTPVSLDDLFLDDRINSNSRLGCHYLHFHHFVKDLKVTRKYSFRLNGRFTCPVSIITNSNGSCVLWSPAQ